MYIHIYYDYRYAYKYNMCESNWSSGELPTRVEGEVA